MVDSSQFKNKNYKNPRQRYTDTTFTSKKAMMGSYKIDMLSLYPLLKKMEYKIRGQQHVYAKGSLKDEP